VQLVLVADQGGVKLTKTYTFKRGSYVIDVKHTVTNATGAAINPSLYLQLVRDGNKPAANRTSTAPSPARPSTATANTSRSWTSRRSPTASSST
jgi:YidC/Oxa1 family membrane protein insertase